MNASKSENDPGTDSNVSISCTVNFDHPVKAWVLQMGGWLPLPFCSAQLLLVDRNVVSALADLSINPTRSDMEVQRWWLAHLNTDRFLINPMLCAIEGITKSVPTFQDFCLAFDEAIDVLSSGLPGARLVKYEANHYQAAYGLVKEASHRYTQESKFLIQVAPRIATRCSPLKAKLVEKEIIEIARAEGLQLQSIVVLCALSCLYERQDGAEPMIGRNVIKPTATYLAEDAHNTLSDIFALEVLAVSSGLEMGTYGYCTRDKYLAALWCALGLLTANKNTVGAQPYMQLFPRLTKEEIVQLLLRLGATKH